MIKKISEKDKKDWDNFLKSNEKLINKDNQQIKNQKIDKIIDLHGYTLENANKAIDEVSAVDFLARADYTYELDINILKENEFIGGYKNNWTIDWSKLKDANKITFHVLAKSNVNEEEMYDLMLNLEDYSLYVPAPEIE